MIAYCYALGLIEFGNRTQEGALPIAGGNAKALIEFIGGVARHGYNTASVEGRPTKIKGSDCLLVPGVPEAGDENDKLDALHRRMEWIAPMAPAGVTVLGRKAAEVAA